MKLIFPAVACLFILACNSTDKTVEAKNPAQLVGTWKLLTGTLIEKGDTTVTPYSGNISFIKIINPTHFAFLQHDLNKGKDSTASFVAGGGRYELKDSSYTEHLEYCTAREWEGNAFHFKVRIEGDTLTQYGVEKVEAAGVDRMNIEKYVRVKEN